jgi:sugar phosphate isomerase/epimerase
MKRRFHLGSSFGVMQGRLSTQTDRGYQAFPWETWESEFDGAAERKLEHIEWVLDSWQVQDNPILSNPRAVKSRINESGVRVLSVCADYLMDTPLDIEVPETWVTFDLLIGSMQELDAKWLVIPCVDQSSLLETEARKRFLAASAHIEALLSDTDIAVTLETDLAPFDFANLLSEIDSGVFGVNYDIGNSASLGYNPDEEFAAYGERVSLVHIKDRIKGGGSISLGNGSADIAGVVGYLTALNFNGPITMQAFRDIEGLTVLDQQLEWLEDLLPGGE